MESAADFCDAAASEGAFHPLTRVLLGKRDSLIATLRRVALGGILLHQNANMMGGWLMQCPKCQGLPVIKNGSIHIMST